jgi:hypothetical protein
VPRYRSLCKRGTLRLSPSTLFARFSGGNFRLSSFSSNYFSYQNATDISTMLKLIHDTTVYIAVGSPNPSPYRLSSAKPPLCLFRPDPKYTNQQQHTEKHLRRHSRRYGLRHDKFLVKLWKGCALTPIRSCGIQYAHVSGEIQD